MEPTLHEECKETEEVSKEVNGHPRDVDMSAPENGATEVLTLLPQ